MQWNIGHSGHSQDLVWGILHYYTTKYTGLIEPIHPILVNCSQLVASYWLNCKRAAGTTISNMSYYTRDKYTFDRILIWTE